MRVTSLRTESSIMRKQLERLALVFLLRILLRIAAQVDALAQMIERRQVLAPVGVERLQHDRALEVVQRLALDLRELARRSARAQPR